MSNIPKKKTAWKEIGYKLSKATRNSLKNLNFRKATSIQAHVIPQFMKKRDIVAESVTGSGKTLSFIIPIMELYSKCENIKPSNIFSLILAPTTELAYQTYEMFSDFLKHYTDKKPALVQYKDPSKKNKSKTEDKSESTEKTFGKIIITTPGCLSKCFESNDQNNLFINEFRNLEIFIMDEADRLLLNFETEIGVILRHLPKQRITGLFSATQTKDVNELIKTGMRNPVRISVKVENDDKQSVIPQNLSNYYSLIDEDRKLSFLVEFIKKHQDKKLLVFFATCDCTDYLHRVVEELVPKSIEILALHKKAKRKRSEIISKFKKMVKGVMFATDIMARGIDIPKIDWVIQYEAPKDASNYLHRCGRTARCDNSGETLLILRPHEDAFVYFLKDNQQVELQEYEDDKTMEEYEITSSKVKDICKNDRLMYEKSVKAFVSFIKFYHNHSYRFLFPIAKLNVGSLANSFGLLRLPFLAEYRKLDVKDYVIPEVDLKALKYKNKCISKNKEVQRKNRALNRENQMEVGEEETKDSQKNKKKQSNQMEVDEPKNFMSRSEKSKLTKSKFDKKKKDGVKSNIEKKTPAKINSNLEKLKKFVDLEKYKQDKAKIVQSSTLALSSNKPGEGLLKF